MLQPHVVGLRHRSLHAQLGAADRHVLQLAPVRLAVDDQRDVFLVGQDEAQRTAALEIPQVLRSNRGRHRSSSSGYSYPVKPKAPLVNDFLSYRSFPRTEETRVGKECDRQFRFRWSRDHSKKKKKE